MPYDIITTNPYANPEKGKLFDKTAQPFQSAEILGLGDQDLNLQNGSVAGKNELLFTDPQWGNTVLQTTFMGMGNIAIVQPVSGTTPSTFGITLTASGGTTPTLATTNLQTRSKRVTFDTGTSATSIVGVYTSYGQWWRGTTTGEGGFLFNTVISQNTNVSGNATFIGLAGSTAGLSGEPSALVNSLGIGYDSTDSASTNWYFMHNDGSSTATKVDTGQVRDTTSVLELSMSCRGASGYVTYNLINRSTSSVIVKNATVSSNLPSSNTFLAYLCQSNNNSTASNGTVLLYKTYIQARE